MSMIREETVIRKLNTYDDVRDLSIRIMEYLIQELAWDKTDQPESVWYPFGLQDGITEIIQDQTGIKEKGNETL